MHILQSENKMTRPPSADGGVRKVGAGGRAALPKPRRRTPGVRPVLSPADVLEEAARGALRVSEMRCRRLFESAREGVLLLDSGTSKIMEANPFVSELLGYGREELVGKELWEIGLMKDPQTSREFFRVLRTNHFVRYEDLLFQNRTGRKREVEVAASVYQEGAHLVIQCNLRDITERRMVQQELLAAKDEISRQAAELQEKVAAHTVQLRQTIGELETFSYSVSHDMRSPLSAMRGFAEILLKDYSPQLDAAGIKYLEKIDLAAGRLDVLIQEVLAYTMVLGGEIRIEPVDLDAVVRQVIETYPQLQTSRAEIQVEGALPKVMGTETSLVQCISNLLVNAVKFVASGTKPLVKIRAQAVAGDVRLWVEDNGIGIAAEDQVRIFQMFTRVGKVNAYEGTGLGLTIVRKTVERLDGQLGVESEMGRGSKFWIQLKGVSL
jgi:PAS domain S-box-containing protein